MKVPAYEALQENGATAQRMMGALLRGVSTRQYEEVSAGDGRDGRRIAQQHQPRRRSKAAPSSCASLRERRWDKTDLLAIYIDGQRFGDHHVISAVGIDRGGRETRSGHRAGRHGKRGRGEAIC